MRMPKILFGLLLSVPLALSINLSVAAAGSNDFRMGGFNGMWCGYQANFSIERQDSGKWVFHGHIMFPKYPQYQDVYDTFDVEQRSNDSLIMVRHLAGGGYQRVFTGVPDRGGLFAGVRAEGPDCVGKETEFWLNG